MVERRSRTTDLIEEKLDAISAQLDSHLTESEIRFAVIERAFPDGADAHRASHEAMIAAAKAEEDFWRELRLDMAKKGVWAVILVVVGLDMTGISIKLGWGGQVK